jgi:branched-chain amino acid transport system permease protein
MLAISLGLQVAYGEDGAPVHAHGSGSPYFAQQLVNGLVLGAIFALVAVGYSLVYAITGVIQLAYGQILTLGAFALILVAAWISKASAVEPALVLVAGVAALACTGAWGGTAQSLVYRPIERHGHRLTPMIAGIGIGVFLENFMRATQGPGDLWLDRILPGRVVLWDAPGFAVVIGDNQVLILGVALVVGITGSLVMTRSRLGRLYRATTDHPDMAALLGVNTKRLTSWVAASGAGLAALSGIAITLDYGEADASMGFLFGFKALTAAMIGGLGSLPGAVCGGFILGMAEAMWVAYLDASYRDAMVFALLCTALVFRPHGLFQRVTADPPDERRLRQF